MADTFIFDLVKTPYSSSDSKSLRMIRSFFHDNGIWPEQIALPSSHMMVYQNTSMYSIDSTLKETNFGKALKNPFIVLNSDGMFHNRTYFIVKCLRKSIGYIHIDAHFDFGEPDSCTVTSAGFVGAISTMRNIGSISIVGAASLSVHDTMGYVDLDRDFHYHDNPPILESKANAYLAEMDIESAISIAESGKKLPNTDRFIDRINRSKTMINNNPDKFRLIDDFNPMTIKEKDVYVSIDLDVLKGFPSKWPEVGIMKPSGLSRLIEKIGGSKRIVGADICGFAYDNMRDSKESMKSLNRMYAAYSALMSVMM